MTTTRALHAFTALSSLFALACGDATSGTDPVAINDANLRGYWVATDPRATTPDPILLHFGVAAQAGEAPAGLPTVETVGFGFEAVVGPYALDGDQIRFQVLPPSGVIGEVAAGTITRITGQELDITFIGSRFDSLTFHRVEGCGAPGLWFPSGSLRVVDAAWANDGSLHMLVNELVGLGDLSGYYIWVQPDRCTPFVPPESVTGDSLDIGRDGTIRIAQVASDGIALSEIASAPWSRPAIDPVVTELTTKGSTYVRPAIRTAELPDGRPMVIYPEGSGLRTWTREGDTFVEAEVLPNVGGVTPQIVRVIYDHDGSIIVPDLGVNPRRWHAGAWAPFAGERNADGHPLSVFTYDTQGRLYGAWGTHTLWDVIIVGRRESDGTWTTVEAGLGVAVAIHVNGDGSVDVTGIFKPEAGPHVWVHVPASFAPNTWRESYTLYEQDSPDMNGVVYDSAESLYPFGRFGPHGEIFVGGRHAAWRRPALETGPPHRWVTTPIRFEGETAVSFTLPTLGDHCEADCTLVLPPHEILPVVLDAGAAATGVVLTGNVFPFGQPYAGPSWALISQPPKVVGQTTDVVVKATLKRLEVTPLGPSTAPLGVDAAANGDLVVAWDDGAQRPVVRVVGATPQTTKTRVLEGYAVSPARPMLRARAGGGAVVAVDKAILFLNAALAEEAKVAVSGTAVVGPEGGWDLRQGGSHLDLVRLQPSGPSAPVPTEIISVRDAAALGSGLVAHWVEDGTSHVWKKLDSDGTTAWTLVADRDVPVVWSARGPDLLILARYPQDLTLGGQRFARAPSTEGTSAETTLIARVDGATGEVSASWLGWFPAMASTVTVLGDRIAVVTASTTFLQLDLIPWAADGEIVTSNYAADVIGGFCTGLAAHCGTLPAFAVDAGGGKLATVWTQAQPTTYDDVLVDGTQTQAVLGIWTPSP